MATKTEVIKRFLDQRTLPDLAALYSYDMECQVNVAQDGGTRVDGEFMGRQWHGWTDGAQTWKSYRVPYKANTDPEYEDKPITFDLAEHAEAIGMTGWDWVHRCSRWVAFDFDAIIGHSDKHTVKLTNEQLDAVRTAACSVDWVTLRKSTSGKGLHLYVKLPAVPTANHNEHAALARAVLGVLSAITGFDFNSKVDICGGNMWVWHRKMRGTDGLSMIREGCVFDAIPNNWRDHVKVITGRKKKATPQEVDDAGISDAFDELSGQRPIVQLDEDHKKLITYLRDNNHVWWWDQDHHMLVTHTLHLQEAHTALGMKGFFKTDSSHSSEHNCFLYPLRRGAWVVRRYSIGVRENEAWDQDGAGWTRTYLNREPDLASAARAFGGIEDPNGGFVFREAEIAAKAAQLLGVSLNIDIAFSSRTARLKGHRDGRLIVEIKREDPDNPNKMPGWLANKGHWQRIFNANVSSPSEPEVGNYDDIIRHLVTESNEDYGWMIKSDNTFRDEPLAHVRIAMGSLGLSPKEIGVILGAAVMRCWKIVNKPFQGEYPGDREWNRNAAQFRFLPSQKSREDLKFPVWNKILQHVGCSLDEAVRNNAWAKANGITKGADYLKCWIASIFQEPYEPLPYLFFYGPQNSGKSILHEGLKLLLTKGYQRADAALTSQQGFNGELEGAIVCVVEETDLRKNKIAYNRIKDWVTSRDLPTHYKGRTPFHTPNTTHWIQCSNDHQACPIFSGDTRIVMVYVDAMDPTQMIPKKDLLPMLEAEAGDFIAELMSLEIPKSNDRLNVPVIETEDKEMAQKMNHTPLEAFIDEHCHHLPGYMIKFSDFYDKFMENLDPKEHQSGWTKIRVGRELPPQHPKARLHSTGQFYIGNLAFIKGESEKLCDGRAVSRDGFLECVDQEKPI